MIEESETGHSVDRKKHVWVVGRERGRVKGDVRAERALRFFPDMIPRKYA